MAGGHGGKREGAGRKKNAEKYESQINQTHDKIADKLSSLTDVMIKTATKGHKLLRETYEPAATVLVDDVDFDPETGRSVKTKRKAFPDLPPEQLVLTRRVIIQTAPDRDAGKYLMNRIAGTPVQMVELEAAQKQQLPDTLEQAMLEAYGDEEDENADGEPDGENIDFLNESDDEDEV